MFWYGMIIGFCVGVVFVTLCYTPLVDKVKMLEQKMVRDETRIAHLQKDLELMQRFGSPELYAQFYDAPYRDT